MNVAEMIDHKDRVSALHAAATTPDGGFTVNADLSDSTLAFGWMVSLAGYEQVFDVSEVENFAAQVKLYQFLLRNSSTQATHIGGWFHDGKIYLDLSMHVLDRDVATSLGRFNRQKAVYEIHSSKAIMLDSEMELDALIARKDRLVTRIERAETLRANAEKGSKTEAFFAAVIADDAREVDEIYAKIEKLHK